MTPIKTPFACLGLMALTACGGGGDGAEGQPALLYAPTAFSSGPSAASYESATGRFRLDGALIAQPGDPVIRANGDVELTTGGPTITAQGLTGDVFAFAGVSNNIPANVRGATFGRLSTTQLPTTGAVTYAGDYAGIITSEGLSSGEQYVFYLVTGDIELTADFGTNSVAGTIDNRMFDPQTGAPAGVGGPVTFASGELSSSGVFGAATVGGSSPVTTAGAGFVRGVVGGANGEEVAGVLELPHATNLGPPLEETGVFLAVGTPVAGSDDD